jgi:hypothetical protein
LWSRTEVPAGADAFGDDQYILLAGGHDGTAAKSNGMVLRALDGSLVAVPDWLALYQRRLGVVGRHLLLSERNEADTTLRLYDVISGQNLWKKTFTANALVVHCQDPNLAGVVEPSDGRLMVFNSRTGSNLLASRIDPRDLDKVHDFQLFSDLEMCYLALNTPINFQKDFIQPAQPGVSADLRSSALNGKIYAFDRTSGKLHWYTNVANQVLVLDQFDEMPMLLFAARSNRPSNQRDNVVIIVKSIEKRSGKLLFEREYPNEGNMFTALSSNFKEGSIEFTRQNLKIVHSLDK